MANLYQNRPKIIIKSRCKFFQFKHLQENVNISLQIKKIAQTCKYKNLNKSNCTKNKLCLVPFLDHLNRLHSSDEFIIQIRASAKSQNSFHDARPKFIHGLESRRDWNGNCRCPERGFFFSEFKAKKNQHGNFDFDFCLRPTTYGEFCDCFINGETALLMGRSAAKRAKL